MSHRDASAGKPPTQRWQVRLPGPAGVLMYPVAHTKSEARATVKRLLNLPRLPVGTLATKHGEVT